MYNTPTLCRQTWIIRRRTIRYPWCQRYENLILNNGQHFCMALLMDRIVIWWFYNQKTKYSYICDCSPSAVHVYENIENIVSIICDIQQLLSVYSQLHNTLAIFCYPFYNLSFSKQGNIRAHTIRASRQLLELIQILYG